ncbi:MAG: hypothetical protein AB7E55_05815 [Pigmentiphaga sp.]
MKLPILAILAQSAQTLWQSPLQCLMAFWPSLIIATGLIILDKTPLWTLPFAALNWPFVTVGSCAWHRHLIQGQPVRLRLGGAEWLYLKSTLILSLIMAIPFFATNVVSDLAQPPAALAPIIDSLSMIVGLWMCATALMALPANALGQTPDHDSQYALVTPHQTQIFMLIAVLVFVDLSLQTWGASLRSPFDTIVQLILLPFLPLTVSSLSLTHLWLHANRANEDQQKATVPG